MGSGIGFCKREGSRGDTISKETDSEVYYKIPRGDKASGRDESNPDTIIDKSGK